MADGTAYEFSDIPVQASVSSAQRASPEQLADLAQQIWGEIGKSGVAPQDTRGNDKLLEELQGRHKDFSTSFPVVLRWMVQTRQFHREAFRKYLLKHATLKLNSREEFLRLQAEYLVILHRETHKHVNEAALKAYRDGIVKQLLDEDKQFVQIQKDVDTDEAKKEAERDQERRDALRDYLLRARGATAAPSTAASATAAPSTAAPS